MLKWIEDVLRVAEQPCRRTCEKRHKPGDSAIRPRNTRNKRLGRVWHCKLAANTVDHLYERHENDDLYHQRHKREKRMVFLTFEQGSRFLSDCVAIAIVLDLNAVRLRHERNHLQAVDLAPKRDRELQNLGKEGEDDDVGPVIGTPRVAPLHQPCEELNKMVHLTIPVFITLSSAHAGRRKRFPSRSIRQASRIQVR